MTNYTEDNKERNPAIEKMVFDILDCALMNAERAVQMMKLKEKHKQEGDFSVSVLIIENNGCVSRLPILCHIRTKI